MSITNSQSLLRHMSIESWCHPTMSSSVVPFSSFLQSCPESGSFPRCQFFTSGVQSIGSLASASVLPVNIQVWFPLGWTGWISFQSKGLSAPRRPRSVLHWCSKALILWHSAFFIVQLSCSHMTTGKTIALTRGTFVGKVMSLLFKMLSRLVITFHPRIKCCLISWLQWLWSPPNKVSHCFHCFPIYSSWSDWTGCQDLRFLNVEF